MSTLPHHDLAIAVVPIKDLRHHPENPRRGDVDAIEASIASHGAYKPLIVQRATKYVLAGNHTLMALKRLKEQTANVIYLDIDDAEALRILINDNRTSDKATWFRVEELLGRILEEEGSLEGTGFDEDELAAMMQDSEVEEALQKRKIPADPADPLTTTIAAPSICSRNEARWLSCRRWRTDSEAAGIQGFKAKKDDLDEIFAKTIAAEMAVLIRSVAPIALAANPIVSAPAARASNFAGIGNYAEIIAAEVANLLGLRFERIFCPLKADRHGHHPARERSKPALSRAAELDGAAVILIDDIATSGATLEAHLEVLAAEGIKYVAVAWVYDHISGSPKEQNTD